jgi:hypothetical protein
MGSGLSVQAQTLTHLASTLQAGEMNAVGFDGAGNAYMFTSYGVNVFSSAGLPGFTELDLVSTVGQAYEGGYVAAYVEDDGFLVADGDVGVTFVDTWDPNSLFVTTTLDLGGACRNVAAQNQDSVLVYCAVDGVGMVIVSVEDNTAPTVVGTYSDPALYINDLVYNSAYPDYLFLAADVDGLILLDVSVPASPAFYSEWTNPGAVVQSLTFHPVNDSLYLALGNPGMVTIDITNLASPTLTGGLITTEGPATDLSAYTYVYLGTYYYYVMIAEGSTGFEIYDTGLGTMTPAPTTTSAPCTGVFVNGNTGYAFMGDAGVEVWNVGSAYSPTLLDSYADLGGARAAFVDGNYAYVANFNAGMTVLDITDPAAPDSLTTEGAEEEYWDVLVNGIYAYALDAIGGLFVYDITDPANPVAGTPAQGPAGFRSMDVSGDYLYIGSYNGEGVHIVDISSPMAPSIGSAVAVTSDVEGVTVVGDRLYVAANDGGVIVYDLTDPSAPVYTGEYATTGNAKMVAADGNTIYVAAGSEGVLVLDATDPANITYTTTITLNGDAQGVTFSGGVLYVAHTTMGVSSYDVSTPSSPLLISTYDSPGMAYEVALTGTGTALLADGLSLEVFDVGGAGVIVSDPTVRPETFVINGNYPNPFNASTALSFSLPATGQVRIEMFDMMGRLVANLYEGELGIGEHRLLWNAGTFSSGLYFAKVSSPWGQKTQKMVLLK